MVKYNEYNYIYPIISKHLLKQAEEDFKLSVKLKNIFLLEESARKLKEAYIVRRGFLVIGQHERNSMDLHRAFSEFAPQFRINDNKIEYCMYSIIDRTFEDEVKNHNFFFNWIKKNISKVKESFENYKQFHNFNG